MERCRSTVVPSLSSTFPVSTAVACWLLLLCFVNPPVATAQIPEVAPFGIDGFRLMLRQEGLATTQTQILTALENPQNTVFVVLGDLRVPLKMRPQLAKFVQQGGSLLVASDIGCKQGRTVSWVSGLWGTPNFQFSGWKSSETQPYLGHQDCPIVSVFNKDAYPGLFAGVNTIVTNRPAQLKFDSNAEWAARYSESTRSQTLMGVWQNGVAGRVLVVADHSLFINEMLIHGDNARFASNVAKWLTKGGQRTTLVVIHDNDALGEWSLSGSTPNIPLDQLLRAANHLGLENLPVGEVFFPIVNQSLGELERQGQLNAMVHQFAYGLVGRRPFRAVSILLAAGLLIFAARRLFFTRGRPQRWLFHPKTKPTANTSLSAAFHERQFQPYMRSLCREFFAEWGITTFSEGAVCPRVHDEPRLHTRAVSDLQLFWNIATSSNEKKLTRSKFDEFVKKLRELHRLQRDGVLRLQGSPELRPVVE